MITAAAIEYKVATAMNTPAFVRVVEEVPLPVTTRAEKSDPRSKKITPGVANFRAAVDEK
jgi:hypothetical protein